MEDKAIKQAKKEGLAVEELTRRNEEKFFQDFKLLRIKRPDYTVRASTVADQAAILIQKLMEKGLAYKYPHGGAENVYYDPLKFKGFGKIAHLDMSQWPKEKRRFHKDTYPGTPWNKGDFVLWHGCKEGDTVCWETAVGRGRPAWNIQDAAMVTKHLGFQVDVACGGVDNLVRHHDYTLAVAEGVSGKKFAKYWLHGEHLLVDGQKMSKSQGNIYYPADLAGKGYSGDEIRFFLIYGHYRRKQNFTWLNLEKTSARLDHFKTMVKSLEGSNAKESAPMAKALAKSLTACFESKMNDDLDVKGALDLLSDRVAKLQQFREKNQLSAADAQAAMADLRKVDDVLQVIF